MLSQIKLIPIASIAAGFVFFSGSFNFFQPIRPSRPVIKNTIQPTATLTPTRTPTPTHIPSPTPTQTPAKITTTPTTSTMLNSPTEDTLFSELNAYRRESAVGSIEKNEYLCQVAAERAKKQEEWGKLDHSGFETYLPSQSVFRGMGEILQYNSKPKPASYMVKTVWANSSGHNASMLNPEWTHGCGALEGQYGVFIFAY